MATDTVTRQDGSTAVVLDANGNFKAASQATENHIGEVGGHTSFIQVTPLVTSGTPAYVSGYGVGGLMTLSGAVRVAQGTGVWESLLITDHANQKAPYDVLIFGGSPVGGTVTDHVTFDWGSALPQLIAHLSVGAGDYTTIHARAVAQYPTIGQVIKPASGMNLYAVIVTSGTPQFAGTADLSFTFGILTD